MPFHHRPKYIARLLPGRLLSVAGMPPTPSETPPGA